MRATYNLWQSKHYLQMKSPMTCMPRQFLHNVHWFYLQLLLGFFVLFCSPLSAARHSCAISQYHWQHWKWLKLYDWYQNNHTKWLQPIMHLWYSVKCDFSGDPNFRLSSDNVPVMNLVIFQNVAKLTRSATAGESQPTTWGSSLFCFQPVIYKSEFDVDIRSAKLMTTLKWH